MRRALLDYRFLESKVERLGPQALIEDFSVVLAAASTARPPRDDRPLRLIQGAVRLSFSALRRDPRGLAGQMRGRLLGCDDDGVRRLVAQARPGDGRPWLRPVSATLTPPGGPLIRTLEGHADPVSSVAVTPDGRRAVSASWDRTLKVWDLETGELIASFTGESGLQCIVAASDSSTIVAGEASGRVHFLRIEKA